MRNIANFFDNTVGLAAELRLPVSKIELICDILQKYSVSCYDITLKAFRQYKEVASLISSYPMRCCVNVSDEEIAEALCFNKICFNWHHKNGIDLSALYAASMVAKDRDLYLSLDNAKSLEISQWDQYFSWAQKCSAKGIIYLCDGAEDVFEIFEKISYINKNAPCPIEFQSKNKLGIATALALSALKAGASCVGVSIGGVGGFAPLEEVLMTAKHLWQCEILAGEEIAEDFKKILSFFGVETPRKKALIGSEVFAHESGIHVDGILKNPSLYEIIKPEDVGLKRKLVIGKHSGTASIKIKFLNWNIKLSQEEATLMLEKVRELAQFQKGSLSDMQLTELYEQFMMKGRLVHECCKTI